MVITNVYQERTYTVFRPSVAEFLQRGLAAGLTGPVPNANASYSNIIKNFKR